MFSISELLKELGTSKEYTISTDGVALWICLNGDLDPMVPQILQDYGGLNIINKSEQMLWFFFTQDVLLALARLVVWSKFNSMSMAIEAFPSTLRVGVNKELTIVLDEELNDQNLQVTEKALQVWVHPKLQVIGKNIPGLNYITSPIPQSMSNIEWKILQADTRLPYTSSQGWYAILHPLGNPLDKLFQAGWRNIFQELDEVIQRNKFKYSLNENFLMVPLDNLRQLRIWVKEVLDIFFNIQRQSPAKYWPCVSVCVDRKGLNFNNELPQKINVNWDKLMAEYPYMSYRNAYLLGEGFQIQDLNFSSGNSSISGWCNVSLEEHQSVNGSIPLLMSAQLIAGENECCFYCGVKTHTASNCPTRNILPSNSNVWSDFASLDLDIINEAFREIEQKITKHGLPAYHSIVEQDTNTSKVLKAVLEVNYIFQLRHVEKVWLSIAKDFVSDFHNVDDEAMRDDSSAWLLLERMQRLSVNDMSSFEREVQSQITRSPRDPKLKTIQGFVWLEKGDINRAMTHFKEAETLSTSLILQAWNCFLQARAYECQNKLNEAIELYDTVQRLLPHWIDVEYRRVVCKIKLGFAEQVQSKILELVQRNSHIFNHFIIDPELERGRIPILKGLFSTWNEAKKLATSEYKALENLEKELDAWFPQEHQFAQKLHERLKELCEDAKIKNYVAFFNILSARPQIEQEMELLVNKEIEVLQDKFKEYLGVLEVIRDEAAWFPFPRALVDFNRNFNECAGIINWAFSANFRTAESFKRAQAYIIPLTDLLLRLEKQLKLLRVFRDATLFTLMLAKTFLWVEIVGLLLCFIIVPGLALYGDKIGLAWLKLVVSMNFWELQPILIAIISVTALSIAALRTTLIFEKHKISLISEAKSQRQREQQLRLEKAKEIAQSKNRNKEQDEDDE